MKSGFLDKLIEKMDRIDPENLQSQFLHLVQEKGLLETIFQSIQEGIIVIEGKGIISYINRSAESFFGLAQDQVRGKSIHRYLREIDWNRILDLDTQEWSKLSSYEIEVRYPQRRMLNFYVVPLAAAQRLERGAVVILRDVTRDRETSASMIETERINAIRLLAAGVAHEIGNPLNALHIHLQLLERELKKTSGRDTETLLDLAGIARNEVQRLDMIITQFLQAIRPARPRFAPGQIEAVLKETLTLLKQEIQNRSIFVEIDRPEPLPNLQIDKDQIKQAFFNVIKNALQAMNDGGRLSITLAVSDRHVSVSFCDTGTGIKPEDFGRIFDPYFTTKAAGSGLGLMIVQRIVHEHGGKIDVQSEPGKGTRFTIQFPVLERRVRLLKQAAKTDRPLAGEESSP